MNPQSALNRLASESSLYLRQHAANPVDWFPWSEEALALARERNKPIFLSVGYSACHWCHVMEHECFENEAIAGIMNAGFICIKVDREERPDLDQIYMTAHHLLNRGEGGGWPLSVFLTPNLTPFYAGTYFPPDERYAPQRPSFPRLLQAIMEAWQNKRQELEGVGSSIADGLRQLSAATQQNSALNADLLKNAMRSLKRTFDSTNGGFGHAPKFPHPLEVKLLLRLAQRTGSEEPLQMARLTLEKMARGGMYDQLGGGFHRYSVDAIWLVPHFEKMLYDNALLATVYIEAYQAMNEPFFEQIARETLDYVLREMTYLEGGFYSTQDADSEGEEGIFFVWNHEELETILSEDENRFVHVVYGTSADGNFEGNNILCRARSDSDDAQRLKLELPAFQEKLQAVKAKLLGIRSARIWPGRDEKVLTAWNGLMITAFAQAGAVLNEPRYVDAAERAAKFVLQNLRDANGQLLRTWGAGVGAKLTAYLEDYSYMMDALVSLYETTFSPIWITKACELADDLIARFADAENGGFFFTASNHESLIVRSKDLQDGSVPSGNAMAATALLRLHKLTGRDDFRTHAERTLLAYSGTLNDNPMSAGQMLVALDFYLAEVNEYALIGHRDDATTVAAMQSLRKKFQPNRVIAFYDPREGEAPANIALLQHKQMVNEQITLYICRNFACQSPIVGADEIAQS